MQGSFFILQKIKADGTLLLNTQLSKAKTLQQFHSHQKTKKNRVPSFASSPSNHNQASNNEKRNRKSKALLAVGSFNVKKEQQKYTSYHATIIVINIITIASSLTFSLSKQRRRRSLFFATLLLRKWHGPWTMDVWIMCVDGDLAWQHIQI